jgi:hypothetical protein
MPTKVIRRKGGGTGYFRKVAYKTPENSTKLRDEWVWVTPPKGFELLNNRIFKSGELPKLSDGRGENTFIGITEQANDKHREEQESYGDEFGRRR